MRLPWSKAPEPEKETPTSASSTEAPDQNGQGSAATATATAAEVAAASVTALPSVEKEEHIATHTEEQAEKSEALVPAVSTATESSAGEAGEDDESKYMKGSKLYLLTFGLFLATFVVALDNTIIATAIPRITSVFDSLNDVGWYGSSYLLTTTSLQPSFGKIYTFFNVKWTYISALFIFELGSVLCGAAVNSEMLIVGRAVAGIGAAALFSGGMTIVAYTVPLRKRAIYIGLLSSTFGIASVVGPLLGKCHHQLRFKKEIVCCTIGPQG